MATTPVALRQLRVDQVGSLLRPQALKAVVARNQEGQGSAEELRQAQDDAIRRVVSEQEAHRLPIVTDGEFRRGMFMESFTGSVEGLDTDQGARTTTARTADAETEPPGPRLNRLDPAPQPVTQRLRLARNRPLEEYRFTQGLTSRPVKVTLIGPDRMWQRIDCSHPQSAYPDHAAYRDDIVAIERRIVEELLAAGCPYVQIDGPGYTAYVDAASLEDMRARGQDPATVMAEAIAADNAVIAGLSGAVFGIYLCRGNRRSMWHREGTYDAIAEQLFNRFEHDRFLLEYDTERAGGFEPLRFVPPGKVVVLGLISTKVPQVETVDALLRRIEAASRYLPVEQLALSPQCGFASEIGGNLLGEDDQWRKLDVMLETAARVWP